jgi:hypothetical protein
MNIALIVLAALLGFVATYSAFGKYSMNPKVVDNLYHLGLKTQQIRMLATIEILGSLGLLVGIWIPVLGTLAALGFALYFLGAVIAHLRVKQGGAIMLPALVLMVVSIIVTLLELAR